MPKDVFKGSMRSQSDPYREAVAITPDDFTDLEDLPRALWVGGAGNINVLMDKGQPGEEVVLSGIVAGTLIPVRVKRILNTSTTATLIVALW